MTQKLEEARKLYQTANADQKYVLESLFPELKESEDERIRKNIITYLKQRKDRSSSIPAAIGSWIAWLEKQGEQKPAWSEKDERMLCDVISYAEHEISFKNTPQLNWLKSLKDRYTWKPSDEQIEALKGVVQEEQVSEEFINALGTMLNDGLPDRYLVSEERIKKSAELLFSIARKQLKNEMQEWSEEDENMLKSIIATCELAEQDRDSSPARHLFEMQANWLKSLKDKYTWKPSDEQMLALEAMLTVSPQSPAITSALLGLYEQLKKLREE